MLRIPSYLLVQRLQLLEEVPVEHVLPRQVILEGQGLPDGGREVGVQRQQETLAHLTHFVVLVFEGRVSELHHVARREPTAEGGRERNVLNFILFYPVILP